MARHIKFEAFNLNSENNSQISFDVRVKTIKDSDIVIGTICKRVFDWYDLQKECHVQGLKTRHLGLRWTIAGKTFDTSRWDIRLQEKLNMGYSAKSKLRFMRRFKVCYEMLTAWASDKSGTSFASLEAELLATFEAEDNTQRMMDYILQ